MSFNSLNEKSSKLLKLRNFNSLVLRTLLYRVYDMMFYLWLQMSDAIGVRMLA
jgi:hypothetical protein